MQAPAIARSVGDKTKFDARTARERHLRHAAFGFRCDQNFGFAVVDNVGKLVRRQERIDARIIEARARAGAATLDITRVVFHEDGVVIEAAKPPGPEKMREAIAARLKLGVSHRLARLRHDEGRLRRARYDMIAGIHGRPPSPV